MTDLMSVSVNRELLRQVVEYVDKQKTGDCNEPGYYTNPIAALRAALEQPVQEPEPVAFVSPDDLDAMCNPEYAPGAHFRMRKTPAGKYVQAIYTAQQPAPVQEPLRGEWQGYTWNPYTAQPRKAVKLTTDEIKEAIRHLYQDATALQMSMGISLDEFRAIEAAVWAKLGVTE